VRGILELSATWPRSTTFSARLHVNNASLSYSAGRTTGGSKGVATAPSTDRKNSANEARIARGVRH